MFYKVGIDRRNRMELFIIIFTILIDQVSKYGAIKFLKNSQPYKIIGDFFQFNYVENRGAAFGILEHRRIFLL